MLNPFGDSALLYAQAGLWVVKLPYARKDPPPTGTTGKKGKRLGLDAIGKLAKTRGNVALKLTPNLVGIDVDLYKGEGRATLAAAEDRWGKLPATWVSANRTDGSGIRLYLVPEWAWGLDWHDVGPGVETIWWGDRYAIVSPSRHPEDRNYYWITPGGMATDWRGFVASDEPCASIPDDWARGLTSEPTGLVRDDMSKAEGNAWLDARPAGPMCSEMAEMAADMVALITASGEGSRHPAAKRATLAVLALAAQGHAGVKEARDQLRTAFLGVARGRGGEFDRLVRGGIPIVVAERGGLPCPRRCWCGIEINESTANGRLRAIWRERGGAS